MIGLSPTMTMPPRLQSGGAVPALVSYGLLQGWIENATDSITVVPAHGYNLLDKNATLNLLDFYIVYIDTLVKTVQDAASPSTIPVLSPMPPSFSATPLIILLSSVPTPSKPGHTFGVGSTLPLYPV